MRRLFVLTIGLASGLLVTGCAGSSSGASSPGLPTVVTEGHRDAKAHSWMDPAVRATHKALLYVADLYLADVRVYMEDGHHQRPVGEITSGIDDASGLFVDSERNLWVANQTGYVYQSEILRYPQGSTTPDKTLYDTSGAPSAIWVAKDQTVYVVSTPVYGSSVIVKYPKGRQQSQIVTDPHLFLFSVVGDGHGNLYAGGQLETGDGEVDVLPAGKTTWQNTGMITNVPSALAFDAQGNLLVSSDAFLTFHIGQKQPSNTIPCNRSDCEQVAFDRSGKHLWAIEAADYTGNVFEFDYPSGKRINALHQPNSSEPNGVAAAPALFP